MRHVVRKVVREVAVTLTKEDVAAAVKGMARCPLAVRPSAIVVFNPDGSVEVQWVERSRHVSDPGVKERKQRADLIDILGNQYEDLFVLRRAGLRTYPGGGQQTMWVCRCRCGHEGEFVGARLREGNAKRCKACVKEFTSVPFAQRICQWCQVGLAENSKRPWSCNTHDRQFWRKGLCGCGRFPYYRLKDCPVPECNRLKLQDPDGVKRKRAKKVEQ